MEAALSMLGSTVVVTLSSLTGKMGVGSET